MFEITDLQYKDILNIEHLIIDKKITCITGNSGSGKTTLLRMLNKLNIPDKGIIKFNGINISQINSIKLRREVLMLPQTPVIYDGNIKENIQIGLEFSNKEKKSDEEIFSILKKVGLNKNLDDDCKNLSGGEKQRLCLARVMIMDASVYLLDEPSAALDSQTEDFIINTLTDFAYEKDNRQLIIVTHSKNIAQKFKSSNIIIEKGRVKSHE